MTTSTTLRRGETIDQLVDDQSILICQRLELILTPSTRATCKDKCHNQRGIGGR